MVVVGLRNMSRTGKKPVALPDKVKVRIDGNKVLVEGPGGKQSVELNSYVTIKIEASQLVVTRKDDTPDSRRLHGMVRALIQNAVLGVSEGFKRNLEIEGVGYRAEVKGSDLNMSLGYSHPIVFAIPAGIKVAVEKQTRIQLTGVDKALIGQVAANIRSFRPPEPYKGKGIRYEGEVIQRKEGKSAAGAGK